MLRSESGVNNAFDGTFKIILMQPFHFFFFQQNFSYLIAFNALLPVLLKMTQTFFLFKRWYTKTNESKPIRGNISIIIIKLGRLQLIIRCVCVYAYNQNDVFSGCNILLLLQTFSIIFLTRQDAPKKKLHCLMQKISSFNKLTNNFWTFLW